MPGHDRWLLIRAGRYRLAVPARQVQGVITSDDPDAGQPSDVPETPSLVRLLSGSEEAAGGIRIRIRRSEGMREVRVSSAEEMIQGPDLVSLPSLLGRALGEASPIIGAILADGRPVLVIDLLRCVP